MADLEMRFTDGAAYERFMGPWTRAVGAVFLDWLSIPRGRRWLDVGCGTGLFTELLLDKATPSTVVAIDPAPAQIEQALSKPLAARAAFEVADAQAMPFDDGAFDVAASALVINFIPDRPRAVSEMRRVVKPGGVVAAYVWDFTGEFSVIRHMLSALRTFVPDMQAIPGAQSSRLDAMKDLFAKAGLVDVDVRTIDVEVAYPSFDEYWRILLANPSPSATFIKAMPARDHDALREMVRSTMPAAADGTVAFAARANAIRSTAPA